MKYYLLSDSEVDIDFDEDLEKDYIYYYSYDQNVLVVVKPIKKKMSSNFVHQPMNMSLQY